MNREEWLGTLADKLRPSFTTAHAPIPKKLRLTCGWPSKGAFSSRNRTIGECWSSSASKDGTTEIFVSPVVSDSLHVAAILVHELIHAAGKKGHRRDFEKVALAMGLTGKMTATTAGPELQQRLNTLLKPLGKYPHAPLDKSQGPTKKDTTRLIKAECQQCGYVVRVTRKWLAVGLPVCPEGDRMQADGYGDDEDDDGGDDE